MLRTNYEDGNIELIRFRNFIQENEIIHNIILYKIECVNYDYKGNFIIDDGSRCEIVKPIDESKHIKAMYEYLIDITDKEEDIRFRARKFYLKSGKWNDIIREFLEKVFKPLVDFITDSLSMEMMIMETGKQETHIHQNIQNNYGSANIAQRDIHSINNVNNNDSEEIIKLVNSLKELIATEEIDDEVKEEVIDDLETIEEQMKSEKPKFIKIKKAYQGIKNFATSIPSKLVQATAIVTQLTELIEKIQPFVNK